MHLLPLPPETVDVDVDRPEDRIIGGRQVAEHVAELRLRVHVVPRVEAPARHLDAAIAVALEVCLEVLRLLLVVRVHAAGPQVHRVVRVLVQKTEGIVVQAAAAEVAKAAQAQDLLDVLRLRIVVMEIFVSVDRLPFAWYWPG